MTEPKHGGTRPGSGRPVADPKLILVSFRLTEAQIAKLKALGGVSWLRWKINEAKEKECAIQPSRNP